MSSLPGQAELLRGTAPGRLGRGVQGLCGTASSSTTRTLKPSIVTDLAAVVVEQRDVDDMMPLLVADPRLRTWLWKPGRQRLADDDAVVGDRQVALSTLDNLGMYRLSAVAPSNMDGCRT